MSDIKKTKVLFAIDPSEPELRPSSESLSWFNRWLKDRDASIEAVYIFNNTHGVKPPSEVVFSDYVNTLNLGRSVDARVLVEKSSSRRKSVDALIRYTQTSEADVITVSSHGRSGPGRLVLGSFAESLLAGSSVPLLFLSESAGFPKAAQKILFPTDLSGASLKALSLFLGQMKGYAGEIVLFHAVSPPGAIFDTGIMGVPVYLPESYWIEQRQWTEQESKRFMNLATERGFRARMVMQEGVLNTPLAIEKCASEESVEMIAMASVSRGLDRAVLGSVAKEIFRLRKWPVWVCGPETVFERNN